MRRLLLPVLAVALLGGPALASVDDCPQAVRDVRGTQPTRAEISAALDAAADAHDVPRPVLRAIAYVESDWRQFNPDGTVLASSDGVCGLGIMQVTADGYGAADQVRLADEYLYNIAEGARILREKWEDSLGTPPPAGADPDDPDVIENWYYAICLYNGCGSDPTYPTKVANVIHDPFRYAPNFTALKAYWFTKPQDAKADYVFPAAFQARYSPTQEFVFYDHTTGVVSSTVAAPTHSLASTPPPPSEYGAATYGPNDTRTTCAQCGGWRLSAGDGLVGRAHWTNSVTGPAQSTMVWDPVLSGPGRYRVSAFVPAVGADPLGTATYDVGGDAVTVDQNAAKDTWRSLGDHTLALGERVTLTDHSAVGGQKIVGDALRVQGIPTLTVTPVASTVTYGSGTTLRIRLSHGGHDYGGEPYQVSLYKRALGTTAWTKIGTFDPENLSVPARPSVNAEYRATFVSPYAYFVNATSAVRRVYVRPKVTAALSGRTVSARVVPAHAGQRVYLQRLTSSGWRDVTYRVLSSAGTASFAVTPPGKGTWYYRAYKRADADHVAGASTSLRMVVT